MSNFCYQYKFPHNLEKNSSSSHCYPIWKAAAAQGIGFLCMNLAINAAMVSDFPVIDLWIERSNKRIIKTRFDCATYRPPTKIVGGWGRGKFGLASNMSKRDFHALLIHTQGRTQAQLEIIVWIIKWNRPLRINRTQLLSITLHYWFKDPFICLQGQLLD